MWEKFHRHVTCRLFGHSWGNRLHGQVCRRCRIWRERPYPPHDRSP